MNTITFYVQALWKSCSDIGWLRAQKNNFGRASVYALALFLVASVVQSVTTTNTAVAYIKKGISDIQTAAPDLRAEVKDGVLSVSGVDQPFTYEFRDRDTAVLLYIDSTVSSSDINIDAIESAKNKDVFVIARDGIVVTDAARANTSKQSFAPLSGTVIPAGANLDRMQEMLSEPRVQFTIGAFLTLVLFVLNSLINFLFVAVIVGIVYGGVLLMKKTWKYGELYTVALFALTLPVLFDDILSAFGLNAPLLGTAILFALLLLVVFSKVGEEESKL